MALNVRLQDGRVAVLVRRGNKNSRVRVGTEDFLVPTDSVVDWGGAGAPTPPEPSSTASSTPLVIAPKATTEMGKLQEYLDAFDRRGLLPLQALDKIDEMIAAGQCDLNKDFVAAARYYFHAVTEARQIDPLTMGKLAEVKEAIEEEIATDVDLTTAFPDLAVSITIKGMYQSTSSQMEEQGELPEESAAIQTNIPLGTFAEDAGVSPGGFDLTNFK